MNSIKLNSNLKFFKEKVFTVDVDDNLFELECAKIGKFLAHKYSQSGKSIHYICVVLSKINSTKQAKEFLNSLGVELNYNNDVMENVLKTFVVKVQKTKDILNNVNLGVKW